MFAWQGMPTGCIINLAKSTVRVVDIVVKMFFVLMYKLMPLV